MGSKYNVGLVVFNVPSTARSFRDGTPIFCPLRRTRSSINTPFRAGIEPLAVAWQSITLPLRYAAKNIKSDTLSLQDIQRFSEKHSEKNGENSKKIQTFHKNIWIKDMLKKTIKN